MPKLNKTSKFVLTTIAWIAAVLLMSALGAFIGWQALDATWISRRAFFDADVPFFQFVLWVIFIHGLIIASVIMFFGSLWALPIGLRKRISDYRKS
jgi:hypothetical protein